MITCTMHGYVYAATKSGRNETIRYLTVTKDWTTLPWPRLPVEGETVCLSDFVIGFKVKYVSFYPDGSVHLGLDDLIRTGGVFSKVEVERFEASGCKIRISSPADPMGLERFRKSSDQD